MNNRKQILLHVTACIAFLGLTFVFLPRPPEESFFGFSKPAQRDFAANILSVFFFYLNYYLLIPSLYFQKKHIVYFIVILAGFLLVCLIPTLLTSPLQNHAPPSVPIFHRQNGPSPLFQTNSPFVYIISHNIFLFFAVVFFSLLLRERNRWFQAESARSAAELSYLKSQINPHFLFNTLNSIYSLAIVKDDRTPDAVIQLSELMRYIIRDANNNFVPLEREISYIENYLLLQQSRLGDTVKINFQSRGDFSGKQVVPLILITYIENAFKHGVNPDENSEIIINISLEENDFNLYVYNKKVNTVTNENGIGFKNTKERLELLYPAKYKLKINDKKDSYTVALRITLS